MDLGAYKYGAGACRHQETYKWTFESKTTKPKAVKPNQAGEIPKETLRNPESLC